MLSAPTPLRLLTASFPSQLGCMVETLSYAALHHRLVSSGQPRGLPRRLRGVAGAAPGVPGLPPAAAAAAAAAASTTTWRGTAESPPEQGAACSVYAITVSSVAEARRRQVKICPRSVRWRGSSGGEKASALVKLSLRCSDCWRDGGGGAAFFNQNGDNNPRKDTAASVNTYCALTQIENCWRH